MFIDEAIIQVKAGDGGNGCHAYERQPFKPKGRPDGGDGGRGGHISVIASTQIHTLQDMAYRQQFKTTRGMHGKGSSKTGKNGEDIVIEVPVGTMICNDETGELIADCITPGVPILIAKGGRGGRGNKALASSKDRNPEKAEEGKPGEEKKLRLTLKVLADVGLVGRPNAGKSTFLSRISHARPKIADYPFTTTAPNLGIVQGENGRGSFVVADIPGLIEGSNTGKGLGIRFLRHIERTRVLAILVDGTSANPEEDAAMLLHELSLYSELLAQKPRCMILTKSDLFPADAPSLVPQGWLSMSAATGENVDGVVADLRKMVAQARETLP
jgi:GTP-binding protein